MSVEALKSVGLTLGNAMMVKEEIDALALAATASPVSPAIHSHSAAAAAGGGAAAAHALSPPPAPPGEERTLASSNFARAYQGTECPVYQHQLFASMHSFLIQECSRHGAPPAAANDLFERLQKESFENAKELLSEIQVAATRIWTSTQKLQGAGVDKAFNVEFCSLLNRALREDAAAAMPHTAVIVRAINALCIVRREDASLKFPPNAVSHRGGALPRQHHAFFAVGKKYRVPMYLATSFSEDKAYEFWCVLPPALCAVSALPPSSHAAGTASSQQGKCPCTGSSTSTPVGSTRCATAART